MATQFETRKDFKKSRARILARFRDPECFEKAFAGAGMQAERLSGWPRVTWRCAVMWQDAARQFELALTEPAADETMVLAIDSTLVEGTLTMDFYDLPDGGCQVIARADLTPRSLPARVALQALRLARGRAENRLRRLITAVARA